jgi:hypothetical protein
MNPFYMSQAHAAAVASVCAVGSIGCILVGILVWIHRCRAAPKTDDASSTTVVTWPRRATNCILIQLAKTRPVLAAHLFMQMSPTATPEDMPVRMQLAAALTHTPAHLAWAAIALLQYPAYIGERGAAIKPAAIESVALDAAQQSVTIKRRGIVKPRVIYPTTVTITDESDVVISE